MSAIIVIEGTDGTGKATQSQALHQRLTANGFSTQIISFPRYDGPFGPEIKRYLKRQLDLDAFAAAQLYAADRLDALDQIKQAINNNDFVIFDRYVSSNLAHQGARVIDQSERQALYKKIIKLEYHHNRLAQPDHTVILSLPEEQIQTLIRNRNPNGDLDKHEADSNYLIRTASCYDELQKLGFLGNTSKINCAPNNQMLTVEIISQLIYDQINYLIKSYSATNWKTRSSRQSTSPRSSYWRWTWSLCARL